MLKHLLLDEPGRHARIVEVDFRGLGWRFLLVRHPSRVTCKIRWGWPLVHTPLSMSLAHKVPYMPLTAVSGAREEGVFSSFFVLSDSRSFGLLMI